MAVKPSTPAGKTWLIILTAVAVVDVWLVRHGHDALSTVCRRSRVGRIFAAYLAAHLIFRIPGDPLSLVARRLQPGDSK